ncbi:hypothetical protein [Cryobacterium sp. PAMC25264]|uniref:hypothetical protein n=1 Tax=Cryobacterium sp. PAMC25264 TaxID=2861288 RepID=UPI002104C936|nr:hypothetical protein [Cryobacterium sp. PAMC25264]
MSPDTAPPALTGEPAPPARRDPALLVVLGLIALLVLVALVVVFTRGAPELLDAGKPGGVVQRYAAAAVDGDGDTAARYLTATALANCDRYSEPGTDDIRVTLLDTTERVSSADVRVSIVTFYDAGPFGSSESESEDVFELVSADDGWLIDVVPWQLMVCPSTGSGDGL